MMLRCLSQTHSLRGPLLAPHNPSPVPLRPPASPQALPTSHSCSMTKCCLHRAHTGLWGPHSLGPQMSWGSCPQKQDRPPVWPGGGTRGHLPAQVWGQSSQALTCTHLPQVPQGACFGPHPSGGKARGAGAGAASHSHGAPHTQMYWGLPSRHPVGPRLPPQGSLPSSSPSPPIHPGPGPGVPEVEGWFCPLGSRPRMSPSSSCLEAPISVTSGTWEVSTYALLPPPQAGGGQDVHPGSSPGPRDVGEQLSPGSWGDTWALLLALPDFGPGPPQPPPSPGGTPQWSWARGPGSRGAGGRPGEAELGMG